MCNIIWRFQLVHSLKKMFLGDISQDWLRLSKVHILFASNVFIFQNFGHGGPSLFQMFAMEVLVVYNYRDKCLKKMNY